MSIAQKPPRPRRPAADLIDAIVENMRANLEELRYSIVAPSRYTVYLSRSEFERLQGLIPRLRAEAIRALDEELARLNKRWRPRRALDRFLGPSRALEHAEAGWHVEFLPDFDEELQDDQDILIASELVLSNGPEVGGGERTRRVTTVRGVTAAPAREDIRPVPRSTSSAAAATPQSAAFARLTYDDTRGSQSHDVLRDSTTIGRGGLRFPVDVRVAAPDDVSREHARIRRDPATGSFYLIDLSTHGTTVDGVAVPRGFDDRDGGKRENGVEARLPDRARIGLAGVVFLDFEKLT
jgi:pSer/pThr/pTyr-binding forkhead associated (FHA) protein